MNPKETSARNSITLMAHLLLSKIPRVTEGSPITLQGGLPPTALVVPMGIILYDKSVDNFCAVAIMESQKRTTLDG